MFSTRERAQTLLNLIIGLSILSVVLVGLIYVMSYLFQGAKKVELRGDTAALAQTLNQVIDCNQTWALGNAGGPIVNATDCQNTVAGVVPKPIQLRDRSGAALTGALEAVVGTFNPLDTTFEGSGQVGEWYLRAYCDTQVSSLVVRAAKKGNSPGSFYPDPVTKIAWDWRKMPPNPVFGSATKKFCVDRFNPTLADCPPGQFVSGVNFSTQTVTCHAP